MTNELMLMNDVITIFDELKVMLNTVAMMNNDDVLNCELIIDNRSNVTINIFDIDINIVINCGNLYTINDDEQVSFEYDDHIYIDYFFNLPTLVSKWYCDVMTNFE